MEAQFVWQFETLLRDRNCAILCLNHKDFIEYFRFREFQLDSVKEMRLEREIEPDSIEATSGGHSWRASAKSCDLFLNLTDQNKV